MLLPLVCMTVSILVVIWFVVDWIVLMCQKLKFCLHRIDDPPSTDIQLEIVLSNELWWWGACGRMYYTSTYMTAAAAATLTLTMNAEGGGSLHLSMNFFGINALINGETTHTQVFLFHWFENTHSNNGQFCCFFFSCRQCFVSCVITHSSLSALISIQNLHLHFTIADQIFLCSTMNLCFRHRIRNEN